MDSLIKIIKRLFRLLVYVLMGGGIGLLLSFGIIAYYSEPRGGGDSTFGLAGFLIIASFTILGMIAGFIIFLRTVFKEDNHSGLNF